MYLGNTIDSSLNLNENFDKKCEKASGRTRLLTKVRPYLNQAAVFDIFNMMIVPLLTYCSIIDLNCTLTHKRLILSIEKQADIIVNRNHFKVEKKVENFIH